MTHFVKNSMPALSSWTVSSSVRSGKMKFSHFKNIDTLPQCIWGSFGINKEQIKVFKELKEHFWRKGVLYQTIKTKERLCHSCICYWLKIFYDFQFGWISLQGMSERSTGRRCSDCPKLFIGYECMTRCVGVANRPSTKWATKSKGIASLYGL